MTDMSTINRDVFFRFARRLESTAINLSDNDIIHLISILEQTLAARHEEEQRQFKRLANDTMEGLFRENPDQPVKYPKCRLLGDITDGNIDDLLFRKEDYSNPER